MMDKLVSHLGLKSKRSTADTVTMLKKALYNKNLVVKIDNAHRLTNQGFSALERIPVTIVATSNHDVKRLRIREKIKIRRMTLEESKDIANSFMKVPDYLADYLARRSNGLPGRIKTMVEDVKIAIDLGEFELSDERSVINYLDSIPLPGKNSFDTNYLILAVASLMLGFRYIFYQADLYDAGYTTAIIGYLMYTAHRLRRAKRN
jgi:hypothetical protein